MRGADLSRRGLLGAIICAPAIVRASSLMAVKTLPPTLPTLPAFTESTAWYLVTDAAGVIVSIETNVFARGRFLEGDYPLREQFLRRAHA